MKKIILSLFAFLIYSFPSFAAMCNPADNIYDYLVPGCVRQDESYIATGTGSDVCLTSAKICSGTQIPNANLAALTSSSMVNGSALYSLSSTPSGAGALPIVNGGTGQTSRQASMDALFAASMSGTTGETLVSNGTDAVVGYPASLNISSQTKGDLLYYSGTAWTRLAAGSPGQVLDTQGTTSSPTWSSSLYSVGNNVGIGSATPGQTLDVNGTIRATNFIGIPTVNWVPNNLQIFTASGTWTKPAICSSAYVKIWGSGGGGAGGDGSHSGGNGGGGEYTEAAVTVSGNVTVTIDAGGAAGNSSANGTAGGVTSFAGGTTISANGGSGGTYTGNSSPGQGAGGTGGTHTGGFSIAGTPATFSGPGLSALTAFPLNNLVHYGDGGFGTNGNNPGQQGQQAIIEVSC